MRGPTEALIEEILDMGARHVVVGRSRDGYGYFASANTDPESGETIDTKGHKDAVSALIALVEAVRQWRVILPRRAA